MYFVILYGSAAICLRGSWLFFRDNDDIFTLYVLSVPLFILGCYITFWTTFKLILNIGEYYQAKKERKENIKRGKKFLEELRKAPYNTDLVGQSFIRKVSKKK